MLTNARPGTPPARSSDVTMSAGAGLDARGHYRQPRERYRESTKVS
jgi:hypothetical protein